MIYYLQGENGAHMVKKPEDTDRVIKMVTTQ